jgi:TonB-linked SusC/RagA family outer membrane protein
MRKSYKGFFTFLILMVPLWLNGQTVSISGTVTDFDTGNKLIGVNVTVKGTDQGTITNIDGEYSISASANDILAFSYIGYESKDLEVDGRTTIDVKLKEDIHNLDEVVVVGYGTQKKGHLTGAVSTVDGDALAQVPIASTTNALTGRVSGLITVQSTGQPGLDAARLSIRGFDPPLVIVDGVPSDFNNIDANEISSISVLKDASAAVYGARAGNGVILVTTKRGTVDKMTINVNSSATFQSITNTFKPLGSGDYTQLAYDNHIQRGQNPNNAPYQLEEIEKYYAGDDPDYPSTNWFDEIMRPYSPQYNQNFSIRGGDEKIKYFAFFGYMNQETMIKSGGGNYNRYNVRTNVDAKIIENLSLSVDLSTIMESRDFPIRNIGAGTNDISGSIWYDLWQTPPIYPASLPDPDKLSYGDGNGTGGAHISSNKNLSGFRDQDDQSMRTKISLNYDFLNIKGLNFNANFIYNKSYSSVKRFNKLVNTYEYSYAADTYTPHPSSGQNVLNQYAGQSQTITAQLFLNYNRTFAEKHNVMAQGIYEIMDYSSSNISAQREKFPTEELPYLFAGGIENQRANGSANEMGRASFIGRLNYNFDEKYLFETTIRFDASAQYPVETRWGMFPSASVGWRLSQEDFIQDNAAWISTLKLRGGVSLTGDDYSPIPFPYLTGYNLGSIYMFGESVITGYNTRGIPNPDLTWETMYLYNAGVDYGFFRNRIYGEFDVFYRLRDGIAGTRNASVPSTFGATLPVENLNSISTRGFEFSVGHGNRIDDFKYNISSNISWSRSKWEFFDEPEYDDPDRKFQNQRTGNWTDRTFGFISEGLFTSLKDIYFLEYEYEEIAGNNSALQKGDLRLKNVNGDSLLNWRDKVELGAGATPHWMFGFNIDLSYKNFSMTSLWQGAFGFYKNIRTIVGSNDVTFANRWTEENNDSTALIPRIGTNAGGYWASSDYFLKSADYLRLKNLSISYNLPQSWIRRFKLQNFRIYLAGNNLLTFSGLNKYRIDPEAPSGQSGYYYPQMKTFSFGIDVSL